jgi:phage shock protein C
MLRSTAARHAFPMTTAEPTPPPDDRFSTEQPQSRHPLPQLRRSATDRMLAGVCGGLAEYTRIDSLLWRVGFIAFALMGPGVIIYLLLWVLMAPPPGVPEEQLSAADRMVTRLHERLSSPRSTGAA